jgi:hypothetical protein
MFLMKCEWKKMGCLLLPRGLRLGHLHVLYLLAACTPAFAWRAHRWFSTQFMIIYDAPFRNDETQQTVLIK